MNDGPDKNEKFPNKNVPSVCFIKNVSQGLTLKLEILLIMMIQTEQINLKSM